MICERRRSSVHISNLSHGPTPRSKSPSGGVANRDALSRGKTPKIYKTRRRNCVSEGTTDKCFMDRWQCEVLAVAAAHRLSVGQASQIPFVAPYESLAAHDAERILVEAKMVDGKMVQGRWAREDGVGEGWRRR